MALSNAVDANAISRTLGYALDFKDTQTAAAGILPQRIAVLADSEGATVSPKIANATVEEVKAAYGENSEAAKVMEILARNTRVPIDVIAVSTAANGEPTFTAAEIETALGDVWYTIVVNPFGENTAVYDVLKTVNGAPADTGGSGRWNAQFVKPFIAISGTNRNVSKNETGVGSADDLTNVLGTAPNAQNSNAEIAAAYAAIFAELSAAKPHLDIAGKKLPVIKISPNADNIGDMAVYANRDNIAKAGISTVLYDEQLQGYVVQDFITFRRMPDQNPAARDWAYCRNLMIDFNIAYNYQILQAKTLLGKVIVKDDEVISSAKSGDVIRLAVWKSAVINFFTQMIAQAYITDQEYSNNSLLVELSGTNPKRINTQFAYKRTETVGIASTTAYAGFSFGEE